MKIYKNNIIKGLKDLSSYNFQKIAWFENDQGLSSSFSDDVAAVFEDTGLEIALNNNHVIFGNAADNMLRDLNKAIEDTGYSIREEEFINSPKMDNIRRKAIIALKLIQESDNRESTVEIVE